MDSLHSREGENALLDEHISWAIAQQVERRNEHRVEVQTLQQKRLIRAVEKGLPRDA